MAKLVVESRTGKIDEIDVDGSVTVMEAIRKHGLDEMLALCGGCCSCATCHVYVDSRSSAKLSPMSEDEDMLLDSTAHRSANSRLSCQIRIDGNDELIVKMAPEE